MKRLPVDSDLTYESFREAYTILLEEGRKCKYPLYILKVEIHRLLKSYLIVEVLIDLANLKWWQIMVSPSLEYQPDEWSVHLIYDGKEVDSVYSPGA